MADPGPAPRLAVLKALGDNTRYAIYLELVRSPRPLTTGEVAETLELHPNTVRPHLERMRDVGLLRVETESRGGVGRPQHRWSLAPDAPSLGLEPPATPLLARLLVGVAAAAGVAPEDAAEVGRGEGRAAMAEVVGVGEEDTELCRELLVAELARLGFDPAVVPEDGGGGSIAFTHCPFAELAAVAPEIVCSLHRGICEGVVDAVGGAEVSRFGTLVDRVPCSVELVSR